MNKDYEMITVKEYLDSLDNESKVTNEYFKISVEKYLIDLRRNERNEKIIEGYLR